MAAPSTATGPCGGSGTTSRLGTIIATQPTRPRPRSIREAEVTHCSSWGYADLSSRTSHYVAARRGRSGSRSAATCCLSGYTCALVTRCIAPRAQRTASNRATRTASTSKAAPTSSCATPTSTRTTMQSSSSRAAHRTARLQPADAARAHRELHAHDPAGGDRSWLRDVGRHPRCGREECARRAARFPRCCVAAGCAHTASHQHQE